MDKNMEDVQKYIKSWADNVLPSRTLYGACAKLVMEEIPELLIELDKDGKPSEGEVADVLILALDIASLCGYDAYDIIRDKMVKNVCRKWTVRNGLLKHVEE